MTDIAHAFKLPAAIEKAELPLCPQLPFAAIKQI